MDIDDVSGALELEYHDDEVEIKVVQERDVDHIRLAMGFTSSTTDMRMSAPLTATQARDLAEQLQAHAVMLDDDDE